MIERGFLDRIHEKFYGVARNDITDKEWDAEIDKKADERVNHPAHYTRGNIETIEIIKEITGERYGGYLVGNIIKYISRYKFKNGVEDLKKARWYMEELIKLEGGD